MKKLLTIATLAFLPLTAWCGQYVGLNLGTDYTFLTNKNDEGLKIGYKAGMTYGYALDSGIRAEIEVAYRKNSFRTKYDLIGDATTGRSYHSMHSWSYMANVLYDIKQLNTYSVIPYVGLGVGYCQDTEKLKYKADAVTESKMRDDRFAYQAIAGLKYPVNEIVTLGLEYHYFCGRAHAKDHNVELALVRSF